MTTSGQASDISTSNADKLVGIVVALPEELRTLTKCKLKQGECCNFGNTLIAYSGAGIENATNAAKALSEKGAKILISWGCAAGLCPEFKPGDLVIADRVVGDHEQFTTDALWRRHIQELLEPALAAKSGHLFTSSELVGQSEDKQQIRHKTQAVALDMESSGIAKVASENNLPFLVIRSIADPVDMDLPRAVLAGLNENGQVELSKLLFYLIRHPGEIIGLIRLGLHFQAAQNSLKIAANQLGVDKYFPAPIAN